MGKKIIALLLALVLVFALAACGTAGGNSTSGETSGTAAKSDLKIGVILVGDETEGYTLAHINGIKEAAKTLGLSDDQIVWFYSIKESSQCYDTAVDLVENYKCNLILANSYGHQDYIAQAAAEYPDVNFVAMTGDYAAISGLSNLHNAFTRVYESRYVSGVVAGLKLKELVTANKLTKDNYDADGNIKIGYVGAYNYSEVVSGYTAFYLGVTSIVNNVHMYVDYTQSWFDVDAEAAMAEKFISDGCVIIGQHADSTGAPSACQAAFESGKVVYSVGYNVDMLDVAPDAALTSATNNWSVYYTYLFQTAMNGGEIATDWAEGYDTGAVAITKLGTSCADGTADYVSNIESQIKDGSLNVFDTSKFTVTAKQTYCTVTTDSQGHVSSCKEDLSYYDFSTGSPVLTYQGDTVEAIKDGAFAESSFRSAPYFNIRIDGITELS